jgi:hypothetical protein
MVAGDEAGTLRHRMKGEMQWRRGRAFKTITCLVSFVIDPARRRLNVVGRISLRRFAQLPNLARRVL